MLAVALDSPRKAEAQGAVQEVLSVIHTEAGRVRRRAKDAAEAIRLSSA